MESLNRLPGASLLAMGAVGIASHQSWVGKAYPGLFLIDDWIHIGLYFVITCLLIKAFSQSDFLILRKYPLLIAASFAFTFGVLDEFHQSFVPNRSASLDDVVSNAIGITIAVSLFLIQRAIQSKQIIKP